MGGTQVFLLRELDSHIFHGSGAALAGVPRTAHFCSARLVAIVVAAELEEPSAWLWPAALRARPMAQQCSSGSSNHTVHRTAMRTDMCVCPFACRRVGNADEPGSLAQRARDAEASCVLECVGVRSLTLLPFFGPVLRLMHA